MHGKEALTSKYINLFNLTITKLIKFNGIKM